MWEILLWVGLTQACPKVYCGNLRPPFCVTWSQNYSEAVLHPCADPDSQCPADLFADQTDHTCGDPPAFELDLWSPYYGLVGRWTEFQWKSIGSFCDQSTDICQPGLYCDSQHSCQEGKTAGDSCIQGECSLGLTCNLGQCTAVGSVSTGLQVSTPAACRFYTASKELVCEAPDQSRSPPPVPCVSDLDCEGQNGSPGVCQCAYNEAGSAFCALHAGDRDYQTFLKAQAELNYHLLPQAYYKAKYFSWLVSPNLCSFERIPEVYMYTAYSCLPILVVTTWLACV